MKTDNTERLRKFESDLAVIEFVQPSASYVEKGYSLLEDRRIRSSKLRWAPYSRNILAFAASVLLVIGVLLGIKGNGHYDFSTANSDARLLEERMQSSHQLIGSLDLYSLQASSNEAQAISSPLATVKEFLVVNCQDCHEPSFLSSLIPENIEDTAADLSRVIKQNIVSRIVNTGS